MSADRTWNVTERDFPTNGAPRQKLEFAVKYAAQASIANDFHAGVDLRLEDTHIELAAKGTPALGAVDPWRRDSMMGCGTALLYLKLVLKHFGCLGQVTLFPNLDEPTLVARIHFGSSHSRNEQEEALFEAITASRPDHSSSDETPVSEGMLTALSQAVAGERGWLDFVRSEISRRRLSEVRLEADLPAPDFTHARARPAMNISEQRQSRWPLRFFALGGRGVEHRSSAPEPVIRISIPAATLAVVKTKTDDKHGWVAAGQTMARAVLKARAMGLSWALFNPMRRWEARAALRTGVGHKGFAQAILRFGAVTGNIVLPDTSEHVAAAL
jgi:hypothetical protein